MLGLCMSRDSTTERAAFLYAKIILRWYAVQRGEVGLPTVVFMKAAIPHGHAHRFRDTFAVGLIRAGVPMDSVQALLGHGSIKVTEKHYSPWVRRRTAVKCWACRDPRGHQTSGPAYLCE